MNELLMDLINHLNKKNEGGHIYYPFTEEESYLGNLLTFIRMGIESGANILIVENERHTIKINELLRNQFNPSQLSKLHFISNFDFYLSNGNFNPPTILEYFFKSVETLSETGEPIYTWGLVEWGNTQEITSLIEQYEREVDKSVNQKGLISVCAYHSDQLSEHLNKVLRKCHNIMLTERGVTDLLEKKVI